LVLYYMAGGDKTQGTLRVGEGGPFELVSAVLHLTFGQDNMEGGGAAWTWGWHMDGLQQCLV